MSLDFAMSFIDCYKTVLQTLSDFSNWLDINAKLVDVCVKSDEERFIVYEYIPYPTDTTEVLYPPATETLCYQLPIPVAAPMKFIGENIFNYIVRNDTNQWVNSLNVFKLI